MQGASFILTGVRSDRQKQNKPYCVEEWSIFNIPEIDGIFCYDLAALGKIDATSG